MRNLQPEDTVGHLTLKEKIYVRGRGSRGKVSWRCVCVCGKHVVRRSDTFDLNKSMSCGCQHPNKHMKGTQSPKWRGCGSLSGQFFGTIKCMAKKRNLVFDITIEQVWLLFESQEGRCAMTGLPLTLSGLRERRRGIEQTASLDRIDSAKGYTIDNVWWVHKDVNMMKKEYTLERFLEICRLVVAQYQSTSKVPRTVAT